MIQTLFQSYAYTRKWSRSLGETISEQERCEGHWCLKTNCIQSRKDKCECLVDRS